VRRRRFQCARRSAKGVFFARAHSLLHRAGSSGSDSQQGPLGVAWFRAGPLACGQSGFHLADGLIPQGVETGLGFGDGTFAIENGNFKTLTEGDFVVTFVEGVPGVRLNVGPLFGDFQVQRGFLRGVFEQAAARGVRRLRD